MKVPIEDEDEKKEAAEAEAAAAEPEAEAVEPDEVDDTEPGEAGEEPAEEPEPTEYDEEALVAEAIRRGEEAAEAEMAADAKKEADDLQKRLNDAEEQLEAAQKQAAEAQSKMLRLQADWENFRRRTATERLAEKEHAAEGVVTGILPVIDDLERAIEHAGSTDENEQLKTFVEGVDAVRAKLVDVLAKEGVEVIDPAGEAFDPLAHQAVGRVEDAEQPDETVAQVYQKGYRMGGKVIRTAMVTVTYGGPKREAPAEEQ